jgi:hypothetical protein
MKPETTRRAVMAGLAAAPVAGLPAIAGAAPLSEPLAAAIKRHKAAWAARCENRDDSDEVVDRLCNIERDALDDLVALPVANDAELLAKLRYLLAYERELTGGTPPMNAEWLSVVVALDLHFNPGAQS